MGHGNGAHEAGQALLKLHPDALGRHGSFPRAASSALVSSRCRCFIIATISGDLHANLEHLAQYQRLRGSILNT